MAMSQADVQSGVGTYEDTLSGTASDTVTATGLKGWLDTLRLTLVSGFSNMVDNIQANTTSITTAITTFFTPSGTVEAYALDLQSLFPFCIPFDIYNLLLALQADPVTPHFDFEISFGSLGSYPVSVDFSDWNGLAELVRTLEIALFIVGLGIKTRELIGG